jgi:hypothetical protein
MTEAQKDKLFRVTFVGAGVLYVWALFIFWMAPEWELSGKTYYLLGVLPALLGVASLVTALGLHVDMRKRDE